MGPRARLILFKEFCIQTLDWAQSINMSISAFDSTYYYRFSNTAVGDNVKLAVGEANDPPNTSALDAIRSFT